VKTCAIVDGVSSGRLLAAEFRRRGFGVVHVRSHEYTAPVVLHSFHREDYLFDIPATAAELQARILQDHGVHFIIAGAECGVERADLLNEMLNLPGNDVNSWMMRRQKYEMVEAIRRAGLRAPEQIKAADVSEALAFAAGLPQHRVILKPQRSSGSNLVFAAGTATQIRDAFTQILSGTTMFGEPNNEVCVQEFLEGSEYIINTVSRDGAVVVTDMWEYHFADRNGVPFLYDRTELLPSDHPRAGELEHYTTRVLDALGIRWGPAHCEVMLTHAGPTVVEVGARLAGAAFPRYAHAAGELSQVCVTVDAYTDSAAFAAARSYRRAHDRTCHVVSLISPTNGVFFGHSRLSEIEQRRSFFAADFWLQDGDPVYPTVDVATAPGIIALIHTDPTVLMEDYAAVRRWETSGIYGAADDRAPHAGLASGSALI
jgi:carbamoylphosphate synthase large subunit